MWDSESYLDVPELENDHKLSGLSRDCAGIQSVNYYSSLITRKVKTVKRLLALGDLKTLQVGFKRNIHIIANRIKAIPYFIFADLEDRRYGGKCTNRTIALKHYDLGAHAVQNSDYRCTEQLFDAFPLRLNDVFVDVGCVLILVAPEEAGNLRCKTA